MKYVLSFRERPKGGAVVPGHLETDPSLGTPEQLAVEPDLTILVHGYNVDYAAGRGSLLRLADAVAPSCDGGIVAVLWPGDHWTGALSYSFEGRDADDSARALARFIGDTVPVGVPISFVAHSLGNRLALAAALLLTARGYEIRQLCLLAAAVDAYSLASPDDYFGAVSAAKRAAVLWSKKDKVLKFAYPAGDLFQAFVFSSDSRGFALGYRGPRPHRKSSSPVPPNVIATRIPNDRKADHGDYLPSAPPTKEQESTMSFVSSVLKDQPAPVYP